MQPNGQNILNNYLFKHKWKTGLAFLFLCLNSEGRMVDTAIG